MADVKWIKITTDMFDNRKLRHLRKLPEGNNIVLIWVMLLTLAGRCNSSGLIFLTENIPYTPKMLADELDFEESTVVLALQALEKLGMVQSSDEGFLSIVGWTEHQNIDGLEKIRDQNRKRIAKFREKQKQISCNVTSNVTVTQGNATDKNRIEEEKNRIDKKENKSVRENTHTIFKRLAVDYNFSDPLMSKIDEWLKYKTERKEGYKETGLNSLLRQIESNVLKFGDAAICNLIDECMANNWKGIIFDRLKVEKPKAEKGRLDWIDEIQFTEADNDISRV